MKASVLVGALGLTGLAIGFGQLTTALASEHDVQPRGTSTVDRSVSGSLNVRSTSETAAAESGVKQSSDDSAPQHASDFSTGPDIQYSDIYQIMNHGSVGSTFAYTLGSRTCNLGDQFLVWQNNGSPGFASNAYRLQNGRLMQIGTSWVKHACCVSNVTHPVCGGLQCTPPGVPGLRPGCMDVYSASWNSNQGRMGPRVNINPFTGSFAPLSSGSYSAITRRLQIHSDDMSLSNYPGSLYFVEGVYVCTSSSAARNMNNNATYRRVTFNQSSFNMSLAAEQHVSVPAIFAWQDHGLGVNTPDPSVSIETLDLFAEGRLFAGVRVSDNGDGTWRYEYAVYNLNSHLAAGSFSVNVGEGVTISNVGFHSPTYHSGENQDMTPWPHTLTKSSITWTTAHSYAENPNANAVRWGSMHNFWFDADQPPVDRPAYIGTFIPGGASGIGFTSQGPDDAVTPCPADFNDDGVVDGLDLLVLLSEWGACVGCVSDLNKDGEVDGIDLLILLADWGDCP